MYNYEDLIPNEVQPGVEEDVFRKPYADLVKHFTEDKKVKTGHFIERNIRVSSTSNVANYDMEDVDPVAGSFESVKAGWAKIYTHCMVEVHNIQIEEAAADGGIDAVSNLFQDAIREETENFWGKIFENIYAMIKADLTASGTYSDYAISRSAYPVLAPYNDVVDTGITPGALRTCQFTTGLNKKTTGRGGYLFLLEPTVLNDLTPQVAQLTTWVQNDPQQGKPIAGGWQPIASFDGTTVAECQGMTVGDGFYIRKEDVMVQQHRPLKMYPVPTGRDSVGVVLRAGVTAYVKNVGKQGMLTNKA